MKAGYRLIIESQSAGRNGGTPDMAGEFPHERSVNSEPWGDPVGPLHCIRLSIGVGAMECFPNAPDKTGCKGGTHFLVISGESIAFYRLDTIIPLVHPTVTVH